jgi:hypothetical protein
MKNFLIAVILILMFVPLVFYFTIVDVINQTILPE